MSESCRKDEFAVKPARLLNRERTIHLSHRQIAHRSNIARNGKDPFNPEHSSCAGQRNEIVDSMLTCNTDDWRETGDIRQNSVTE